MIVPVRFKRLAWSIWALIVLAAGSSAVSAEAWRVKVQGQGTDLGETPVVVELKTAVPPGDYVLKSEGQGKFIVANVFNDGGKTYLGLVLDRVSASTPETYTMQPGVVATNPPGVALKNDGVNVEVSTGGKLLTRYVADFPTKPYYFPVIGPTGAPVTRAYPMQKVEGEDKDHNHQRSFWFTHGKVNNVDFWASDPLNGAKPNFGTIKETSRKTAVAGYAVGLIRTTDDWLGPKGEKVCQDERVIRFYNTSTARVIDFDITIKAADGPVTFGDTKEGMFGLRVASSMDVQKKKGGKITNADGLTDDAAWGKASPWVDYVGPVEGKTVGIAILNHPDSFRYPTTWHVRTYGLFAANPFGWHDFGMKKSGDHTIPAGQSIRFAYRVILHPGETASADLPNAFQGYAKPPIVEVRAE